MDTSIECRISFFPTGQRSLNSQTTPVQNRNMGRIFLLQQGRDLLEATDGSDGILNRALGLCKLRR
jgi:hypothetical protein